MNLNVPRWLHLLLTLTLAVVPWVMKEFPALPAVAVSLLALAVGVINSVDPKGAMELAMKAVVAESKDVK